MTETSVHCASKLPVSFFLYSQPVMAPPPPTDDCRVSLPVPAAVAVGLAGLSGLVRKAVAVATTVPQALSL